MRLSVLFIVAFLFNVGLSFGQLPSKVEKLEGNWRFKEDSGYEVWELKDQELIGHAFRVSKLGDTSKVEDFVLNKINDRLTYSLTTYNIVNDSLVTIRRAFIGGKRKMEFINLSEDALYSIEYKFRFLNKNKLKVIVQNTIFGEPYQFALLRIKE